MAARLTALESTTRAVDARLESLERAHRGAIERLQGVVADGFQEVASRALVLAEATDEILTRHAAALDRIEAVLARVDERPDARESVTQLGETIAAGRGDVEQLRAGVDALATKVDVSLSSLAASVTQLGETLATDRGDVEQLRADLDAVVTKTDASIASLAETIESAAPGREEAERRVADLAVAMARLQATMDGVVASSEVADLRSRVELVADRLGALLGGPTLTELMDRIDELGEREPATPKRRRLRSGE